MAAPSAASDIRISVVMPAWNAERLLPQVLAPLLAMQRRGEVLEVIVVDDRSTDATAETARRLGARVLTNPSRGGPGAARNFAAREAEGDVLWFVDSDVVAWPDGAWLIRRAFRDPTVHAVFGSYDDAPPGRSWISRYKNLVHRFYHQGGRREASTFWAGCGAVRKTPFLAVGGFDVATYTRPSVEDIELGYRMRRAGGRILLLPDLLGTHLKVWTLGNVIRTDIFQRAIPWSRLLISREGLTDDLNIGLAERARAALAVLLALSLLALPFAPALWPAPLALAAAALAANRVFFRSLRAQGGPLFALSGVLFHQVYYVYSAAAFAWCLVEARLAPRGAARAPRKPIA